ncbi:alpha/beta fold hydrolase [Cyanobium sp. Aljojuca 7D2]|nr:alpha/beta fold hydrolase [Cyanobium sp. Aljojuca 7D2]
MAGQGGARQASLVPPIVNCLEHDVSRPLLVALHGWLLAGRLWTPLAAALAPDWELWAPDLPGFGQRARPRGLHANLASYGRWLAQAAREQAGERLIVLVGHSLGGSVALHAAPHLGDQLVGLVQIAAGGGVYQPRAFAQVRRGGALFLRWRPGWLAELPGTDPLRSPLLADRRAAQGLLACSTNRGAVRQIPMLTARLQVPSLWISGSRDQVMAPSYVRHLAGYADQHQVVELAGAGHLPMRQMPAQLAAPIRAWLAQAC